MAFVGITNFLDPNAFFLLIPLLLALAFILFREFVKIETGDRIEKRNTRISILLLRGLVMILLVTALAHPFGEVTVTTQGDPKITILVDNSTSMEVLETGFFQGLQDRLEAAFPVTVRQIGSGTESDLGEEILNYLEKDTNLLLVTDGYVNRGAPLEEVALLAADLNSTISALSLNAKEDEAGVYVTGPETSVQGVNNTYVARIVNLKDRPVTLRVLVDSEEIFNGAVGGDRFSFETAFDEGAHRIIAEVFAANDHFPENNRFYKTVTVVKKPKILLVQDSYDPVEQIFRALYDVTKTRSIPENVNDYYAVILNDMSANVEGVDRLADYLIDKDGGYYGNGLFAIGGFDSFDRGGYKGSVLESYLPVTVGKAAQKRGSSNIAIAIDLSSSSSGATEIKVVNGSCEIIQEQRAYKIEDRIAYRWENVSICDSEVVESTKTSDQNAINKALAVSVINSLGPDNQVGAVIYASKFGKIQDLTPLFMTKADLIDKVSRAEFPKAYDAFTGEYYNQNLAEDISQGLNGAYYLLKDRTGNQNIILISNGGSTVKLFDTSVQQRAIDTAKTLNSYGVKIYVVGTGRDTANTNVNLLKDIAYNGGGIYFPADRTNNLKILFGEGEESKFGDMFDLVVLNPYHFITQDLSLQVGLYGFNQVIPKSSALTLITTQHGEPAVTVWNYGFGRVAALNVFSGNNNLGDILNQRNSILLTRIVNWAIGDPQRKEDYYVAVSDARIDSPVDVIIKSSKYPDAKGLSLVKIAENQYKTTLIPEETGFAEAIGREYAVNYPAEYQLLGMNRELSSAVEMSGGIVFGPEDADTIIKFVKSVSKKTRKERTTIVWPFLLAAGALFLLEMLLRRMREQRLS